jgi:hypothetical protein
MAVRTEEGDMPKYDAVSALGTVNGVLRGQRRAPSNPEPWRTGNSMHNEEAAKRAGFRGALVPGVIHAEQFAPLALAVFGRRWFEQGAYSFYFRTPTCHLETVQAFLRLPASGAVTASDQLEAWSETEDGLRVIEGTLAVGAPVETGALRERLGKSAGRESQFRILAHLKIGQAFEDEVRCFPLHLGPPIKGVQARPGGEGQILRRDDTTEPLGWYFGPSPWGGPIANPLGLHRLLKPTAADGGLIGGVDVRMHHGPTLLDRDYVLSSRVAGMDESPRTENLWCESQLCDAADGTLVADLLVMTRYVKKISPLYADQSARA